MGVILEMFPLIVTSILDIGWSHPELPIFIATVNKEGRDKERNGQRESCIRCHFLFKSSKQSLAKRDQMAALLGTNVVAAYQRQKKMKRQRY